MRLTTRRDGTIRLECVVRGEYDDPERVTYELPGWDAPRPREVVVGDVGCLVTTEDVSPDAMRGGGPTEYGARLWGDELGFPGNSDHDKCRLHGWRGTTNDVYVYAWGWRRVESIAPRKRGRGWVMVLSADLMPGDD